MKGEGGHKGMRRRGPEKEKKRKRQIERHKRTHTSEKT